MNKNKAIGIFDSGIGGVTVLKEILKILPNENYIYYSDSRNNPYGDINAWNSFSNSVGADFHFAIHSNGSTNHTARGIQGSRVKSPHSHATVIVGSLAAEHPNKIPASDGKWR